MNKNIRMLTEGGIMLALAVILNFIKIYSLPNGGSVTAGSMVPLLFFAMRWGIGNGVLLGVAYGALDFLLKPYFFHPIQVTLDYVLAFGFLGIAGIVYVIYNKKGDVTFFDVFIGTFIAISARAVCHVVSGFVFFKEYAGDQNPLIYSLGYNLSYLIPELIISTLILGFLFTKMKKRLFSRL